MSSAALKSAEQVVQMILDELPEPPDARCSCHVSPPCDDCVNFWSTRVLFEEARAHFDNFPKQKDPTPNINHLPKAVELLHLAANQAGILAAAFRADEKAYRDFRADEKAYRAFLTLVDNSKP